VESSQAGIEVGGINKNIVLLIFEEVVYLLLDFEGVVGPISPRRLLTRFLARRDRLEWDGLAKL
jgi:hypothetical protein